LKADGRYRFRYTNGTYDTTIVRRNGDVETAHAEAGVHVSLDEGTLLTAKGYFHGSSRGLPGAIVAGRFSNAQRQADRTFFLQLSLRREREGRRTMVGAKWSGDRGRYEDPDYLVPGGLVNVFRQEEWYASAVHAREVARWLEVSLAVDASRQGLRSNVASFPDPSRVSLWGAVSARAWWERLTVQGNLLACGAWERVKRGRKPGAHRVFCPVVSLSWQPTRSPGLRTRFFYKRSFRLPTFNDIYYVYPIVVALRPEFTTQYNAGVAWVRERAGRLVAAVEVQGDVYYNRVRDKIVGFPSGNIGRWTMVNLGRATVTGVEVNGRVALAPGTVGVDAGVTYTWQRAVDATPGDTRGCRVPYVPEHAGTATVAASRGAWRLNYSFIYTGERFSRRDNAREGREAAWCTHDVSLGYRRGVLRVDAEVNNVLNRYYSVVRGYPMPGRSWRLGLSIMI
jgi:outer membrane cobalamin receptor